MEIKQTILEEIKQAQKIVICRHIRPDGDCIGSSLGLRDIIKTSFPEKEVYSVGDDSSQYLEFINDEDENNPALYEDALVIVVDTANMNRISTNLEYLSKAKKIIKIDHHIPVDHFGDINYVLDNFPSCCQIIVDFLLSFKELSLSDFGAKCLFLGMATDTGYFQYPGVDAKTFHYASKVLEKNFVIDDVYKYLKIKDISTFKLEGYLYKNLKLTTNGVAYIYFSLKTQKKYGVSSEEAAALVGRLGNIRNSLIWAAFVEYPNKDIRVRLRSRYVAINTLANSYRGGGHAFASGATVLNKKEIQELLNKADVMLKEYRENHPEAF